MGTSKQKIVNYYLYDTEVENIFISEFMPKAPEDYVKVYLLGLMAVRTSVSMDDDMLALQLGIDVAKVKKAWDYWQQLGLVKVTAACADNGYYEEIEFENIKEKVFGGGEQRSAGPVGEDRKLSKLCEDIQKETGRLLDGRELEEIVSWVKDYNMDYDFIFSGYKYCHAKNKAKAGYVKSVLKDWMAQGIDTAEKVNAYLSDTDVRRLQYKKIFTELGILRIPTAAESRTMDQWFDKYGHSMEEICAACGKASGMANPFKYVDKILSSDTAAPAQTEKTDYVKIVEKMYEADKAAAEEACSKLCDEIFAEIPRVQAVSEEIREKTFALSKAMLSSNTSRIDNIRTEIKNLEKERKDLLVKSGYDEDALSVKYSCPKCKDTGLLDDGSRCSCFDEKLKKVMSR